MRNTLKITALACTLLTMSIGSIPQTRAGETGTHYWAAISICPDGTGLATMGKKTREEAEAAVLKGGQIAQAANSKYATPCKTEAAEAPLVLAAVHCIRYRDLTVVREESFIGIDLQTPIETALEQAHAPLTTLDEAGESVTIRGFDPTECSIMTKVDTYRSRTSKWRSPTYYQ